MPLRLTMEADGLPAFGELSGDADDLSAFGELPGGADDLPAFVGAPVVGIPVQYPVLLSQKCS